MTKPLLILARACAAIWSLVEHIKLEKNKTKSAREKKKIALLVRCCPIAMSLQSPYNEMHA